MEFRRYSAIVGGLLYGFLTIWMHAVEWFAALASQGWLCRPGKMMNGVLA
jgi:hypothetical protein